MSAACTDRYGMVACLAHGKITYVRGRLKFGGAKDSAPFPSAIVVFESRKDDKYDD